MKSFFIRKALTAGAIGIIFIGTYWLFFSKQASLGADTLFSQAQRSNAELSLISGDKKIKTNDRNTAAVGSLTPPISQLSKTTYRPKDPRPVKLASGVTGADGFISRKVPNWWLYANSEAEAKWLDQFGFPTPSEEAKLKDSSDAELAVLAGAGDLNARAHQLARMSVKAFSSGNATEVNLAANYFSSLLIDGGPYQATVMQNTLAELWHSYNNMSDSQRTLQVRQALAAWGKEAEFARAISAMYGDDRSALNIGSAKWLNEYLGLPAEKERDSLSIANSLGAVSEARVFKGLEPLTLNRRPEPPQQEWNRPPGSVAPAPIVLERY